MTAPTTAETRRRTETTPAPAPSRTSGPFPTRRQRLRYLVVLGVLGGLALVSGFGYLALGNPMPFGSAGFWRIAELRVTTIVVIATVAFSQTMATVSFQTVTNNRIITPSVLGFEALYVVIQTAAVYFFGVTGLVALQGLAPFVVQVAVMVVLSVVLYGTLLSGRHANLQVMLLTGIVIGIGLTSVSTFMRRLLTPSEFDVLAARMLGSIANADGGYLPVAVPLSLGAGALLWRRARRLNVFGLGPDTAADLGVDPRRELLIVLTLVSVLVAVSTALVGPMTFLGFLVATLAYQFADTNDHRLIFPIGVLTGFGVQDGAYVVMKHVFYAQGLVSIIIEF
ncbi:MAG: iron chelate uptake ABC transporter family permease subunit, partial [Acidimicrobiales bacterium]